ncbi:hypothetical protein F4811DRAFT_435428 [Daldinia bambusicola]|nr:hypothetical protein F4811DRAFT_435428 [Daldinia bambusicola]
MPWPLPTLWVVLLLRLAGLVSAYWLEAFAMLWSASMLVVRLLSEQHVACGTYIVLELVIWASRHDLQEWTSKHVNGEYLFNLVAVKLSVRSEKTNMRITGYTNNYTLT